MAEFDQHEAGTPKAGSAFDRATLLALSDLGLDLKRRVLRRGEILVREGEPADRLFIVMSGRFSVHADGSPEPLAEIAQGELIGEIGFFAGLPRIATVIALRDAIILEIDRADLDAALAALPHLRGALLASLARRLAKRQSAATGLRRLAPIRTLALVPAGESRNSLRFLDLFRKSFKALGRIAIVTHTEIEERFPGLALDDPHISNWLNGLEEEADCVLYVCDEHLGPWTHVSIRQADTVLFLAEAGAATDPNRSERLAMAVHPAAARQLVILHPQRSATVTGTPAWLTGREVFQHHHVALSDRADVSRLCRFLGGRALGLVASGGGSFGSAHLGVYKAFSEAGAVFDCLGGTSAGAAMAAGLAMGADVEAIDRGTGNIFVRSRAFKRPTLPRYALLDHKAFDRALHAEYGDVLIEDLWLPFFALSSNLSDNRPYLHRRGKLWQAVRASGSIPGLLPPFFTPEGDMLVDGAIMDNMPLAPMKEMKRGPNLIVGFDTSEPRRYAVDYDSIPGSVELAARMMNPFGRRRLPEVPGLFQVIAQSMLAHRPLQMMLEEGDLFLCPPMPPNLSYMDWTRHSEVVAGAYRAARERIRSGLADSDPRLMAVLGGKPPEAPKPEPVAGLKGLGADGAAARSPVHLP
jgi:NTE family protein